LDVGTNAPPDGKLGAYQADNGGVHLAVQVQGELYGTTNPASWDIGQSAAAITISGKPLSDNRVAGSIDDSPNEIFTYSIRGGKGWTDTPGIEPGWHGEYKFFFTSSLTLRGTDVNCDVQWGFDLKVHDDNTWSIVPWGTK
jgi:hypothetical protein